MKTPIFFPRIFDVADLLFNTARLAGLAVPFVLAWNNSIVAIAGVRPLEYWRGFCALLVWHVVCLAAKGVAHQPNKDLPLAGSVRKPRRRR